MAEFQELLDFPPAPKLDLFGRLEPSKCSESELRGEKLFFGKAKCSVCHVAPYYTDNLMHNLRAERFFESKMVNGLMESADGPIKTFPLRGIKDSPPYLHDGRLPTLEDTTEFFNLIFGLKLTEAEKVTSRRSCDVSESRLNCLWSGWPGSTFRDLGAGTDRGFHILHWRQAIERIVVQGVRTTLMHSSCRVLKVV